MVVFVDKKVARLHPMKKIRSQNRGALVLTLPAGEACKTWRQLERNLTFLAKHQVERSTELMVVGGGAACDVGSLTAALYRRGMPLVLVPTTLLAMVDAAYGGKCAIDGAGGLKNSAGTFYPAVKVVLEKEWLRTLPVKEKRSGAAELLKILWLTERRPLAAVLERDLGQWLRSPKATLPPTLWRAILRGVAAKKKIVARDPFDRLRIREQLNFGHTVGHALETLARGRLTHGEAVAWGMWVEAAWAKSPAAAEIRGTLERLGYKLPIWASRVPAARWEKLFLGDKKVRRGKIELTAIARFGRPVKKSVAPKVLAAFTAKTLR